MSTSSKSPRGVLIEAHKVGQRALADYGHSFSPKKFTQPQLFACLVLKSFLKTDYRGVVAFLHDCPELARTIDLDPIPHFTTLQKAGRRLLKLGNVQELLAATLLARGRRKKSVHLAAIDSTGLQSRHCSSYYVKRRSREPNLYQTTTYQRFPKLGVICDTQSHMVLDIHASRGPCPDVAEFKQPVKRASRHVRIKTIVADAGYDSESNHAFARDELSIQTLIPAKAGRPTHSQASGKYRRLMQTRFDKKIYGQRWQCETVVSMIKRHQGDATRGRTYWSQCRDLYLMALTHNVMILFIDWHLFYRAGQVQFIWMYLNNIPT